jgi:phage regulator Rha-like protein
MKGLIPQERIEQRIFIIRGEKAMIDRDLAELYGVKTKYLNQQVRRNIKRFPHEFMFLLTKEERNELVAICNRFQTMKHSSVLPYAFTEHGVAMLASVLRSERAIKISIIIVKAFVKLRELMYAHKEFAYKLRELERRMEGHDTDIKDIFEAIRQLIGAPEEHKKITGFANK